MRDLQALQDLMTAAVLKGDPSDIHSELVAGRADAGRRFRIYSNNTFLSLTSHLKTIFPVTARIGDERFFAYAAHEFIKRHPPREARLSVYGGEFSRFLSRFPACRQTPILAEMAALEWAVHSALITAERPALLPQAMARANPARIELQPSLRFAVSRWPLVRLWSRSGEISHGLPRRLSRIAVVRRGDSIRIFELGSARYAFWRALARDQPLETAAARVLARDPLFDLVEEILTLFRAGLVAGIASQPKLH